MNFKEYYLMNEGIKDWILPILLASGLIVGTEAGETSLIDQMSDKVQTLVKQSSNTWEDVIGNFIDNHKKLSVNLQQALEEIQEKKDEIIEFLKDENVKIRVRPWMKEFMSLDTQRKRIYIRDREIANWLRDLQKDGLVSVEKSED